MMMTKASRSSVIFFLAGVVFLNLFVAYHQGRSIESAYSHITHISGNGNGSGNFISIMIPDEPDEMPYQKVLNAINISADQAKGTLFEFQNKECNVTSQVRLIIPDPAHVDLESDSDASASASARSSAASSTCMNTNSNRKWKLQSLDVNGRPKTIGGG